MSVVIDFTQYRNTKRADARIAEAEAAERARLAERREQRRVAARKATDNHPAADLVADLFSAAEERAEQAEKSVKYVPAYCDPNNEFRGAKYDATRNLTNVEVAKRIRADIKDLLRGGAFPNGIKVSVRSDHNSIDVRIKALPESMPVYNPEFLAWRRDNPHDGWPPFAAVDQLSKEFRALKGRLSAIHDAYNRDNSDSMVDYFDVRYYGHVELDWQLADLRRKTETERL